MSNFFISFLALLYFFFKAPLRLVKARKETCLVRTKFFNFLGARIHDSVVTQTNVEIYGVKNFSVGKGSFLGAGSCFVTYGASITIGENVLIAAKCYMITSKHRFALEQNISEQGYDYYPIEIGDDVWIGANVTILPGVRIGKGCVIGANSTVTKDVEDYSICVGSPAVVKGRRQ